ncbi:hypothetical protein FP66_04505 [Halomonas salina]|uniref:Uncharacterized protein n=1 Tax=Halomonas salina TaxID=42565 RepID=A0ABR4WUG6_9GAMM|nr:hypothetical protein FP66_04505 [Halomonas salina]
MFVDSVARGGQRLLALLKGGQQTAGILAAPLQGTGQRSDLPLGFFEIGPGRGALSDGRIPRGLDALHVEPASGGERRGQQCSPGPPRHQLHQMGHESPAASGAYSA